MSQDVEAVRLEAAKPDGVLPPGFRFADNRPDVAGQLELLQEAKGEIERMGPNPAMLGRSDTGNSGRALLARQQSGLIELSNLYAALEDWELRVYRQCWGRVKQYWTAPQFIRVTDDEDAPRFVGLNQPVMGGAPSVVADPATGMPMIQPGVLGYRNLVAEMDVDIEIDSTPDVGSIAAEQFSDLMRMLSQNPYWQQQVPFTVALGLSTIPHKRGLIDQIKAAQDEAAQQKAAADALQAQHVVAKTHEAVAGALKNVATGKAAEMNALTYAHEVHADHVAAGFEAGVDQAHGEQEQEQAQGSPQQPPQPRAQAAAI
jgi:hypothetical protein